MYKKIDFLKPDYQNIPLNHTSYRSTLTIQQCGVTVEQTIVFASCRSDASRSTIRRSAISQNVPWELEDNQTKNCPHREKNLKLNIHDHWKCLFSYKKTIQNKNKQKWNEMKVERIVRSSNKQKTRNDDGERLWYWLIWSYLKASMRVFSLPGVISFLCR